MEWEKIRLKAGRGDENRYGDKSGGKRVGAMEFSKGTTQDASG